MSHTKWWCWDCNWGRPVPELTPVPGHLRPLRLRWGRRMGEQRGGPRPTWHHHRAQLSLQRESALGIARHAPLAMARKVGQRGSSSDEGKGKGTTSGLHSHDAALGRGYVPISHQRKLSLGEKILTNSMQLGSGQT